VLLRAPVCPFPMPHSYEVSSSRPAGTTPPGVIIRAEQVHSFEVNQLVEKVYARWRNYENLAEYTPQVRSVCRTGQKTSHWVVEALGIRCEWDAEVTADEPDRRIAWRSTAGLEIHGEVPFEPLGPDRTRVTARFDFEGLAGVAAALGNEPAEAEDELRATLERS